MSFAAVMHLVDGLNLETLIIIIIAMYDLRFSQWWL
jgi:hypothetical protein